MQSLIIGTILRHILSGIGGGAIAHGVGTSNEWEAIVGGAVALTAVIASYFNKKRLAQ